MFRGVGEGRDNGGANGVVTHEGLGRDYGEGRKECAGTLCAGSIMIPG